MKFGAIGSALGTFLCEIVICIIVQSIYYSKVGGLDMKSYYKEMFRMLPGLILPVAYGLAVDKLSFVKTTYPSIVLHIVIYVIIYATSMWLFAMNDYEKGLARKSIAKVTGRLQG